MRRRRLMGRSLNRIANDPQVSPQLIEANRLFQDGDYNAAAQAYETLAEAGLRAPRFTAQTWIQAGMAHLHGGQVDQAMPLFHRGLDLLAEHRRLRMVHNQGERILNALQNGQFTAQAAEIRASIEGQISTPLTGAPQPQAAPARLPVRCPTCDAPVDPRVVEWVDARTAECNYCGNMLRAED